MPGQSQGSPADTQHSHLLPVLLPGAAPAGLAWEHPTFSKVHLVIPAHTLRVPGPQKLNTATWPWKTPVQLNAWHPSQYLQYLWLQWFLWVFQQSLDQAAFKQLKFLRLPVRILRHLCISSNTYSRVQVPLSAHVGAPVRVGWRFPKLSHQRSSVIWGHLDVITQSGPSSRLLHVRTCFLSTCTVCLGSTHSLL